MTGHHDIMTTETPAEECRGCGLLLGEASDISSDQVPGPGNLTICLYCGELSRFNTEMERQPIDPMEQATFAPWLRDQIEALRAAIREMSGGPA